MAKRLGVIAEVDVASQAVAVTGAPGGAGIAAPINAITSQVTIANTSVSCNIQFKVNAGSWVELAPGEGAHLEINLASDGLYLRRATIGGGLAAVQLGTEGAPILKTQSGAPLGGISAMISPAAAGVGDTVRATLPAGVVGTLQFTRSTIPVPPALPVKTNIAGAVDNAVNSLAYTIAAGDAGYAIGVDASNQVSASAGVSIAVPPVTPNPYARFIASMNAVAAGTNYSKIAGLGDSTQAGARSLGASANALSSEVPIVYLKNQLNAVQALPAIASSWIGDQSYGVTNGLSPYTFDPRLTQPDGAGFTYTNPTPRSVAGSMLFNGTNANRLGFLPEIAVDTFDVYYPTDPSYGTMSLTRTGSAAAPVNLAGTAGVSKATLTGTLSSANPLYAAQVSGGAYVIGMDAYNSAIKTIRMFGLGWSGGKVADWIGNTNAHDPLPALLALNLDLVIIRPGINDAVAGTAPATFKAQLATLVDALLAAGTNVALATQYPSNVASAPQATQDALAQQVRDVATARGLSVRDTYAEWGTWANANSLGYMADNLHPIKAGYQAEAVKMASFVLALAGRPLAADTTPPVLQSLAMNGGTLTATYNEALTTTAPTLSSFALAVNGAAAVAPTSASVNSMVVTLGFAAPVTSGQTISLSYAPGASAIRDAAGNNAAAFTSLSVTNNTAATGGTARLANLVNMAESGSAGNYTYTGTGAGFNSSQINEGAGVSTTTFQVGADGSFSVVATQTPVASTGPEILMGVSTSATTTTYNGLPYAVINHPAAYAMFTNGSQGAADSSVPGAANDRIRVTRAGSNLVFDVSKDGGATWTVLKTYAGVPTGVLYVHVHASFAAAVTSLISSGLA